MRAREFVSETGDDILIIRDAYGGFLKFRPNPELNNEPLVFSMSYINKEMAKFYGVSPRILGFDSHGHRGIPEPHLHGFSKRKSDQIKLRDSTTQVSYEVLVSTFFSLYSALILKFNKDSINVKN